MESNIATHVVVEISWGAQSVVTVKREIAGIAVTGQFDAALGKLK